MKCPYCEKELEKLRYGQYAIDDVYHERITYFCPHCNRTFVETKSYNLVYLDTEVEEF